MSKICNNCGNVLDKGDKVCGLCGKKQKKPLIVKIGIICVSIILILILASIIISIVYSTVIWPNIKKSVIQSAECSMATDCKCDSSECECSYENPDTGKITTIKCPADN